jgi:hypothetical protein
MRDQPSLAHDRCTQGEEENQTIVFELLRWLGPGAELVEPRANERGTAANVVDLRHFRVLISSNGLQIGGPAQGTKLEDLHVGLRYAHSLRGLVHR